MRSKTYEYRSNGSVWGLILIMMGIAFLGDNLGWFSFDVWEIIWPAMIILVGLQLLFRRNRRVDIHAESVTVSTTPAGAPPAPPSSSLPPPNVSGFGSRTSTIASERINESHLMGELDLGVNSQSFRGGSMSTVFGDIRIDCTSANLADGEQVLSLNTVFGTVRLYVPVSWEYSIEATTVFGEVEAAGTRRGGVFSNVVTTTLGFANAPRRLRINASTVFGEVRVVAR